MSSNAASQYVPGSTAKIQGPGFSRHEVVEEERTRLTLGQDPNDERTPRFMIGRHRPTDDGVLVRAPLLFAHG